MASNPPEDFHIPHKSAEEIRKLYLDFFKEKNHKYVHSASVAPNDDPTLLFTNAGMNQFKAIFLGDNTEGLKRAVNSQKVLRVSGKHNDLDEVGRDGTHHTFFEMLGNWSFGDYYKKEAITWAWELLTKVYKMPKERLFATVYKTDTEAEELWKTCTDIDHSHIMRFDEDNFWEMGAVGPCGPCSEIHFDRGEAATQKETFSDPVLGVNGENERYVEIWNLVFMQHERLSDGSLKDLKDKHVDTGSGFERLCSVMQNKTSNYDTDVFKPLIDKIVSLSGVPYSQDEAGTPHRVLADHIRALTFAITDGATPGNEGRGYVVRRILRRASRFAHGLGQKEPFLFKIVATLVEQMKATFPELEARQAYCEQVIEAEERRFLKTLGAGLDRFAKLSKDLNKKKKSEIPGADAFLLHDTYGFPIDLTMVLAEENKLTVDQPGYEQCMKEQRERARSAAKFGDEISADEGWVLLEENKNTFFCGYETLTCSAKTLRYKEHGDDIYVVLDKTPFYSEGGGQVGDRGLLFNDHLKLRVEDTVKLFETHLHRCSLVEGLVSKDSMGAFTAEVDQSLRNRTLRNHSATHLLHASLKQILGSHVDQQGSHVNSERLRFDFTHHSGVTKEEQKTIENLVNAQILENYPIKIEHMGFDEAKTAGAVALFGEKYGDEVRVLSMGEFSKELCGGTHAQATGDIGLFKITSESSIAAGVRRIEAVTGKGALQLLANQASTLEQVGSILKAKPDDLVAKSKALEERCKSLEKELAVLKSQQLGSLLKQFFANNTAKIGGVDCLVADLPRELTKESFNSVLEKAVEQFAEGACVMTHSDGENLTVLATVAKTHHSKCKAGDLVKTLCLLAEGRGGGRPDRARGGSKAPQHEQAVLAKAKEILTEAFGA